MFENEIELQKLRERHEESFIALYDSYGPKIYTLALRMSGHPEEAEDITQETFLQAYRSINNFKGESRVYTWLYRIAKNLCYKHVQRRPKGSFRSQEVLIQTAPRNEMPSDIERLERLYVIAQVKEGCLTGLVRCLSLYQRTAFILHVLLELPIKEVAVVLDKSEGAVKVLVHRARQRLKKFLCAHCSLFAPGQSCRCEGLVDFSLKQGWISRPAKEELETFTLHTAKAVEEELEQLKTLTQLYRTLPGPEPSMTLARSIQRAISNHEQMIFSAKKV